MSFRAVATTRTRRLGSVYPRSVARGPPAHLRSERIDRRYGTLRPSARVTPVPLPSTSTPGAPILAGWPLTTTALAHLERVGREALSAQ